jgi:hypothetical protein
MRMLFFILLFFGVIEVILQNTFINRLRKLYPTIWEELGKPTIGFGNSNGSTLNVMGYQFKRKYRTLNNDKFIKFSDFVLLYNIFYLVFFVSFIVIIIGK